MIQTSLLPIVKEYHRLASIKPIRIWWISEQKQGFYSRENFVK
jgi:hypothetical protein